MPITVADFPSLTDDLQSIFNEVAKTKVAEMKGNKVFNVFDTNRRTFDHLILHGVSGVKEVTPGQDLPNIIAEEGKVIALYKFLLINGETLIAKAKTTLSKQIRQTKNSLIGQLQRLSEETLFSNSEAIVWSV